MRQNIRHIQKLVLIVTVISMLFTACSTDSTNHKGTESQSSIGNSASKGLKAEDIAIISIRDFSTDTESEYTDTSFISEFLSFLAGQQYQSVETDWDTGYQVKLFGKDGSLVADVSFGYRSVSFDRDIQIGSAALKKGKYEVNRGISDNLAKFSNGTVLNPVNISYPVNLKVPGEINRAELINKGSTKVNRLDVISRMYDFIGNKLTDNEFEATGARQLPDYDAMAAETDRIKKESRCIDISFSTSETYLDIEAADKYPGLAKAGTLLLADIPGSPGKYRLAANNMIFEIKTDKDFDRDFQSIFSDNESINSTLVPEDIKELFEQNKPHYMEFISANLGIPDWNGREPDRLESLQLSLNSSDKPYEAAAIYNPFDVRLLFYKKNGNESMSFIDSVYFGGRAAGTEYHVEKAGNVTWLVGNSCRGYGTGEGRYYKDWYLVTDEGSKLVLSFPYDEHLYPPFGGYEIMANNIKIVKDGPPTVRVKFDITKSFLLDLDIADEDGMVKVGGDINAVFKWNEKKKTFTSAYTPDEFGVTVIPPQNAGITQKCDEILDRYFDKLIRNVDTANSEAKGYEKAWRIQAIKDFISYCSDGEKKAALLDAVNKVDEG